MSIREKLGLGPKQENRAPLVDDTVDITKQVKAEQAAAEEPGEQVEERDSMASAAAQLENFELSRGSASLLDRALDSISRNNGAGLDDPDAVLEAKLRAQLIKASGNSLSTAISGIVQVVPVDDMPSAVYSLLYSVMRNVLFFANLDYRAAQGMDVNSEDAVVAEWFYRYVGDETTSEALGRVIRDAEGHAIELSPDERERDVEAPVGFETRREAQLRMLQEQYGHGASGDRAHLVGADSEDAANAVLTATSDLRLFFQLTAESFGWDPERPMPYGNVRNPDGTFTPITDVEIALDATEIKRKAAQAKRKEKNRATLSAAALAAQAILAKALDSKKVHLKR